MHIWRDPFTLVFALIMPVLMVLLLGSSIEFNVQSVPTAYVNQDNTPTSRTFLDDLSSSHYFKLFRSSSPKEGLSWIEQEKVKALILIPPHFESSFLGRGEGQIQVLLDGTDNSAGNSLVGNLNAIQAKIAQNFLYTFSKDPFTVKTRFLYNPELNSSWFVVPALAAVIMAILSLLLTALTVSREWENGSMELLLSTPVKAVEVVLGKVFPYSILGLFAVFIVYIVARTFYQIPFVGSSCLFWLATFLFLITHLGFGLLISTLVRNQQAAVQIAMWWECFRL
jgi:ABC-2 type transport system permease protein